MRVLLANPDESLARTPNLALGYLASVARGRGHEVALADACQSGASRDSVEAALRAGPWDVVGLQAYSCGYPLARRIARDLKASSPATRIVLGGRHATALPREVLSEEPAIDYAIAGEAEVPFGRLLDALASGAPPAGIAGLWWRDGAELSGAPPEQPQDLDALPLPAWDLIAPGRYPVAPVGTFTRASPIAPVVTSRGCAFRCAFCAAPALGPGVRYRSPAAVVAEIEMLVRRHGAREIQILDDNFTLRRSHAVAVCEALLARGLQVPLSLPNGVRLDRLDPDLVRLLERAGCYSVAVGIDSGSQRILDAMDRQLSVEEMAEQIALVKRHSSIRITGNFILGLPGETAEDVERTIAYACRLPLDRAYFGLYLPLPGSALFERLRAEGRLEGLDYAALSPGSGAPPFVPDGLTSVGLQRALRRAYLRFYSRPRVALGLLREVHDLRHAAFVARKAFRVLRPRRRPTERSA